jgi:hypothetical protein
MPLLGTLTITITSRCFQCCEFDPPFACTILQFSYKLYQQLIVWHLPPSNASAESGSNEPEKQKKKNSVLVI